MDTPPELQTVADERGDVTVTHRDYDGEHVIAVDFGPGNHPSVETVGDTVIVVVGDQQYEFELPEAATDVTVNDGILSITG
jgi:hypothetical protein